VQHGKRRGTPADSLVTPNLSLYLIGSHMVNVNAVPLHAWLFLPTDTNSSMVKGGKFPVVVMAHGFSLDKVSGAHTSRPLLFSSVEKTPY
jgi:fermentation-respiration switch protein FrsA (DUF1100 family)